MNLKELKDEIKRLKKKIKEMKDLRYKSAETSFYEVYGKLEGIKQTVEAVDELISLPYYYEGVIYKEAILWQEIKELLKIGGKNGRTIKK